MGDRGDQTDATEQRQLIELDCLRGLAITLVFTSHAIGTALWLAPAPTDVPLWQAFGYGGHTGVTLFFVLSGFLLSRPLIARVRDGRPLALGSYALRRVRRIMPLYAASVVLAAVIAAEGPADLLRALPFLAFLQAIPGLTANIFPFSAVWWSLATEAQFYVALPLLAASARTRRGRLLGGAALLAYGAAYLGLASGALLLEQGSEMRLASSLVGRGPVFAIGILAAVVYDRYAASIRTLAARPGAALAADAALVAAVAALGLLLRHVMRVGYYLLQAGWPVWHAAEAALWTAVLLLLLTAPARLRPLIVNRAWGFVGRISYPIYLVHLPLLVYARVLTSEMMPGMWNDPVASSLVCAAVAAVTVALASAVHVAVERPIMQRRTPSSVPLRAAPALGGAAAHAAGDFPPGGVWMPEAALRQTPSAAS